MPVVQTGAPQPEDGPIIRPADSSITNSEMLDTEVSAAKGRAAYLERMIQGNVPVFIGLAGPPRAGKSWTESELIGLGVKPADKLLPRHSREGEAPHYKPWVSTDVAQTIEKADRIPAHFDTTPPSGVILGDVAMRGMYAIPAESLRSAFVRGQDTVVILGRAEENYLFGEGVREILPLAPVAVLQLEVPPKVLIERAMRSFSVAGGELEQRLAFIEEAAQCDQRQMLALAKAYSTGTLLNLSADEVERFGYAPGQVKPVTTEIIAELVESMSARAREQSAVYAADLMKARKLEYGTEGIPDSVADVLANIVEPQMRIHNVAPFLVGGLGVALYMAGDGLTTRPVSPDIDFVVGTETSSDRVVQGNPERMLAAVTAMTGKQSTLKHGGYNPQYLSIQDKAEVESSRSTGAETVELDCIVAVKLMPGNSKVCFELPLDSHSQFFRREVELPSGKLVPLAPPEQIMTDKLIMGRGQELGKFDLFDCAGLLSRGDVDLSYVRRLVDYQHFDPSIDTRLDEFLRANPQVTLSKLCEALEIEDERITAALGWTKNGFDRDAESGYEQRALTLDGLKRLAMVARLCKSLDKIKAGGDDSYSLGEGREIKLADAYDFDVVQKQAERLKNFLIYYIEFILDRADLHVKHPAARPSLNSGAFLALRRQTEALLSDY